MNTTTKETIYVLGEWQCQFMDLASSVRDCSRENPGFCVTCPIEGKFFTGESIRDYYSSGHLVCLFMWVLTVLIGALGVFTNCLIIGVIRSRNKYRPFDYLLMVLAIADILCCVTAIFAMSAHVARYHQSFNPYIISVDFNPIILLEFWAPFPILLVFNGLSFTLIGRISKRRREMNAFQQKSIDALRMFLPVVIALIITNIVQIAHLYPIVFLGAIYRELISAFGLSVAVNSSVNFHIFYHQRPKFQQESKAVLHTWVYGKCTWSQATTRAVQLKPHRTAGI
ncbi:unnamed protein product [Orchesella dallaii]|uniref:FMRFamide receptor n=1 Tax=Orchesella dallaii TaxID=48710 RepID=A0ABP1PPI0_9HEXA